MGEITLDLRLVIKIPSSKLTSLVCPPDPAPCCNSRTAPWLLYASTKKTCPPTNRLAHCAQLFFRIRGSKPQIAFITCLNHILGVVIFQYTS